MLTSVQGVELFSESTGSGPPLYVLHGGLGLDHTYLRPWLDPLGASRTLVYVDLRGNGRSEAKSLDDVTHATWADDVDALRRALGHDRIGLLGHSYGALIALEYALRHPGTLDALVLAEVVPALDYPDVVMANAQARATPAQLGRVGDMMGPPVASDAELERLWRDVLPLYFHRYDPAIAEAMNAHMRFRAAAFNRSTKHCLPAFNITARLPEIRVPTLVMGGRHDWIMPPAQGPERVHAGIAGSELVIFEESGHFPFIEENAKFLRVVKEWLARR